MFISSSMSHTDFNEKDMEKFEKLFIRKNKNECWEWLGAKDKDDYGDFSANLKKNKAHRVSYVIYNKTFIPKGSLVLHSCDNPSCINPNHLFIGSVQDNSDDMKAKKRQAFGERNAKSKLTDEKVYSILYSYYFGGKNTVDLEKEYGVKNVMIGLIVKGRHWNHVYEKFMADYNYPSIPNHYIGKFSGDKNPRAKLKSLQVKDILIRYFLNHEKKSDLAIEFNVSREIIYNICSGETWRDEYNSFMEDYSE